MYVRTKYRHNYGKYICNSWNLNGFHSLSKPYNTQFKKMVLENIFADFWIITETHCRDNENIDLESYEVFHNNRIVLNSNRKGSGGIAVAINKSVLETHSIENIFKDHLR